MTKNFYSPASHGFVRVACVTPKVHLGDPMANLTEHLSLAERAGAAGADIVVYPELSLSAYSLDDLFTQEVLLDAVKEALAALIFFSTKIRPVLVVGLPLRVDGALYNCAAVIANGKALGIVPKSYLPNYREYYERRYFASGAGVVNRLVDGVLFGTKQVFAAGGSAFTFGVEICEDLWVPNTPATPLAVAGANLIVNLSASPVVIGKSRARKRLCAAASERLFCAYAYSAAGPGESTTDLAWDGQSLVYELGNLIAEGERFTSDSLMLADVDLERVAAERLKTGTFHDSGQGFATDVARTGFDWKPHELTDFHRQVARFPYVPDDASRLDEDCYEAFNIQVHGLMQRVSSTGSQNVVIGVSGGLDSTHALIVACKAFDRLGIPRANIHGYTMPGFGTSTGSKNDALKLMKALGISAEELDIRPAAKRMLMDIGHPYAQGEKVYDIVFENVQAGLRTDFLFRLAGIKKGFVVGTGDLSELALGWCTYGVGDHMSHYNVNCGAPKTLIQHLIRWAANREFDAKTGRILTSVLTREISPELIPIEAGQIQRTEDKVGPYELQDFNLYYITRFGLKPSKVAFLSYQAWKDKYELRVIRQWLEVFLYRFFTISQFKRSAVPNGPKLISGGALSPRGDWRAPSDGNAKIWLDELRENVPE
ncbi:putative glutamine-dependent NAD+ synthetase [Asticcacaulis biprosthecium C19]|uniref:Glutamine-dependent NAD(+) synthetase n=1 Tax=Asticcacaulis biprosthecium C19 TaxID=715226 RepID=F4QLA3_9CAUL|nr:NAD(+) synthase [Asticcacaulis biprosthecium]EGF92248.1 putative glutamine-dependent NAD+ synthetase [Asticcacaulis biprosthecium C19]